MELGGNAPFLVFDDADVDAAVEGAVIAKMRNIGEACTAANRFHVAEKVQDEFTEKLAAKLADMPVGRGTEDDVKVGPLIDGTQRDKVAELVDDATGKGAQVVLGGTERDGAGYFYDPTVLAGVPVEARLLKEEIFGPVAPVASVRRRGGRGGGRQRHRVRARRLRLHARHQARVPRLSRGSRPAWSASTRASSRTRRRRSAASSSPASGARAAPRASTSTSRSSTWR